MFNHEFNTDDVLHSINEGLSDIEREQALIKIDQLEDDAIINYNDLLQQAIAAEDYDLIILINEITDDEYKHKGNINQAFTDLLPDKSNVIKEGETEYTDLMSKSATDKITDAEEIIDFDETEGLNESTKKDLKEDISKFRVYSYDIKDGWDILGHYDDEFSAERVYSAWVDRLKRNNGQYGVFRDVKLLEPYQKLEEDIDYSTEEEGLNESYAIQINSDNTWKTLDTVKGKYRAAEVYNNFKALNNFSEMRLISADKARVNEAVSTKHEAPLTAESLLTALVSRLNGTYGCDLSDKVLKCTDADKNLITITVEDLENPIKLKVQVTSGINDKKSEEFYYAYDNIDATADFISAVFIAEVDQLNGTTEVAEIENTKPVAQEQEEVQIEETEEVQESLYRDGFAFDEGGTVGDLGMVPILPVGYDLDTDEKDKVNESGSNLSQVVKELIDANKEQDTPADNLRKEFKDSDEERDIPSGSPVLGFKPIDPVVPIIDQAIMDKAFIAASAAITTQGPGWLLPLQESFKKLDTSKVKEFVKSKELGKLVQYLYEVGKNEDTFTNPILNAVDNNINITDTDSTNVSGNGPETPKLADDIDPAPTEVQGFPKDDSEIENTTGTDTDNQVAIDTKTQGIKAEGTYFDYEPDADDLIADLSFDPRYYKGSFAEWYGKDLTGQTFEGDLDCSYMGLANLYGCPSIVTGDFYCTYNKLVSLEGAPQYVGGNFYCEDNPNLTSLDGLGEVKGEIISDIK